MRCALFKRTYKPLKTFAPFYSASYPVMIRIPYNYSSRSNVKKQPSRNILENYNKEANFVYRYPLYTRRKTKSLNIHNVSPPLEPLNAF